MELFINIMLWSFGVMTAATGGVILLQLFYPMLGKMVPGYRQTLRGLKKALDQYTIGVRPDGVILMEAGSLVNYGGAVMVTMPGMKGIYLDESGMIERGFDQRMVEAVVAHEKGHLAEAAHRKVRYYNMFAMIREEVIADRYAVKAGYRPEMTKVLNSTLALMDQKAPEVMMAAAVVKIRLVFLKL